MKFSSRQEFELKAHQCFNRIFELLMQVDAVVKKGAEKEEEEQAWGEMCDMRDWIEETILQCHLAWQYHRLSKGPSNLDTWAAVEGSQKKDNPS